MKVCIIVNEYPPDRIAGTAMATQSLVDFLREQGISVYVIVTERLSISQALTEENGLTIQRLRHGNIPLFRWIARICSIFQIIKRTKPDVVHSQALSCGFYGMIACFPLKIPLLLSIQGQDIYQSSHFQRMTEVVWPIRFADSVTAVTKQLAELAQQISGREDIRVIPHGFIFHKNIPQRDALRKMFNLAPDEFIVVCVARLSRIKGVDILIKALASVPHAKLWLIGDGEDRDGLERSVRETGLSDRVHFWGKLKNQFVQECLAAADVFVLPSRSEAFGIVLLEAMNAGLPVVATRVGGIPELISPENGILIPPENEHSLAEGIRMLMNHPELREKIRFANLVKAERYRWEVVGASYLKLYRDLIKIRKFA